MRPEHAGAEGPDPRALIEEAREAAAKHPELDRFGSVTKAWKAAQCRRLHRLADKIEADQARIAKLEAENARLAALLNTPEIADFAKAVLLEAAHQRERWGSEHDEGKEPVDWLWLLGYLAGKALNSHISGDHAKALHHTITVAAACCNWHAAILGKTDMRPGCDPARLGLDAPGEGGVDAT